MILKRFSSASNVNHSASLAAGSFSLKPLEELSLDAGLLISLAVGSQRLLRVIHSLALPMIS